MSTTQMMSKPINKLTATPIQSVFQRLMSIHWAMALCYLILFVTGTDST